MKHMHEVSMDDPNKALSQANTVGEALASLTVDDWLNLDVAAANIAGNTGIDPSHLLLEAIKRAQDGRRNWPTAKGVPFVPFLRGTMKSIKFELLGKELKTVSCHTELQSASAPSPEDELVKAAQEKKAKEIYDNLFDHFEDDEQVTAILLGKTEGLTPREIQEQGDMNKSQYDTAIKRLYRHRSQQYPRGGENE